MFFKSLFFRSRHTPASNLSMAFHYIRIQSKLLIIVSSLLPLSLNSAYPSLPPLALPDFSQFPSLNMLLCLPPTASSSQPSSFKFSSTLRPSEPLPSVSFKMVLPAPWWSRLVRSPCSCSSGQLPLSKIILFVVLTGF